MGIRYIGSKARIAESIIALAGSPAAGGRFVDGFCGTGAVAQAASRSGWPILINDSLRSAVITATAGALAAGDVPFSSLGGYQAAVTALAAANPREGFIFRTYSPASGEDGEVARLYFTRENAKTIDGMRRQIRTWQQAGMLTDLEETLLLADLLAAANGVANTAGTYGCFLANWTPQAQRPLRLEARQLAPGHYGITTSTGDVSDVEAKPDDVVYYDPPYTKRQYAAYYHILETIAIGDEPVVGGVTGLRPWQSLASDFCYKARALDALTGLIATTTARTVLLSYSDEAHVAQEDLVRRLAQLGEVTVHPIDNVGRYRPNATAAAARTAVHEYVIRVKPAGA